MTDLLLPAVDGLGTTPPAPAHPRRTPYLDFDVPYAVATYRRLAAALPGTALHYAVKANPDPTLLAALARLGLPVRRGQPGRDHRRPDGRRRAGRPRLLQPGQAARGRPVRRPARRRAVRRRLPRRGRQGRRGGARRRRAVPAGHLGRRVGLAAVAQVRLLDRRGRRDPARRGAARPAGRRGLLPRRLPAARPRGLGRPDRARPPRSSRRCARTGSTRGCSTSAAASRPGSTTAARHRRRTAPRSSGTWPPRSATAGRPRSPSPAAGSPRTPACWSPPWSASCTAPAPAGSSSTPASSPGWWRPSTRRSATRSPPTCPARPARACSPARPATAPTCSTSDAMVELPLALAEGDQVRFHCAGAYTATYSTVGLQRLRAAADRRPRLIAAPRSRPVRAAARGVRLRLGRHRAALAAAAGPGLGPVRRRPARGLGRRPGRRGPDGAVRPAVVGGRLAGRPRPPRPAGARDDGAAAGVPGAAGGRASPATTSGSAWSRPRWRSRPGRRPTRRSRPRCPRLAGGDRAPGHRAAGHHRGVGLGRRPGARRAAARRSRCGPGPCWSPSALAALGLACSTGDHDPGPGGEGARRGGRDAARGAALPRRRSARWRGRAAQPGRHRHRRGAAAAEPRRLGARRRGLRGRDGLPRLRRAGRAAAGPAGARATGTRGLVALAGAVLRGRR